jgi:hypothetical protein
VKGVDCTFPAFGKCIVRQKKVFQMHAVGSEIWSCSGIMCEDDFFVRGSRSCLRTSSRGETNVLAKFICDKDA